MPWFNVDDSFWSHPKFLAVNFAARGLWVSAGSWCAQNLTDGWLPDAALPMLAMGQDVSTLVAELEAAALWLRGVGGWQFKDWTDCNKPREWHEKQREMNRERQRRWAEKGNETRWDDAKSNAVPNALGDASGSMLNDGASMSDDAEWMSMNGTMTSTDRVRHAEHVHAPYNKSLQSNALGDALLTSPNPTQLPVVDVGVNAEVVVPTDRSAIRNRERFDKFWAIAVRKTGKGAARKALDRALTKTSEHHLAAAWRSANHAWATWPDRSTVPHPATWLNQERWDDDPPQPHTPTSKTLNALDRANQMEINDDPRRLPPTPRPSLTARPASDAR